jgi:hypothetical protein
MGLKIALAPRARKSVLALDMTCSTDVKETDMRFSWIGDGIFAETIRYCNRLCSWYLSRLDRWSSSSRKVINFHRQERAKAIALVAKYPHLYEKNK